MDNQTAIGLAVAIAALLLADYVWADLEYATLAAKKLLDLMGWLAFWR